MRTLRQTGAWRKARARVLTDATACHICGGPLDFDAPPRSRFAPSVDHIAPLSLTRQLGPEEHRRMAFDPHNLRPAHYGCNSRRRDGRRGRVAPITRRPKPSRDW